MCLFFLKCPQLLGSILSIGFERTGHSYQTKKERRKGRKREREMGGTSRNDRIQEEYVLALPFYIYIRAHKFNQSLYDDIN